MTSVAWEWDASRKRYVYVETRRALSRRREAALRHAFASTQRDWADDAAAQLANGNWTIQKWEREARERIKLVHLAEYMFGHGGKATMTQADYGRVGRMIRTQYDYLHRFALDIVGGEYSEARVSARLTQYFHAGTLSFERGRLETYAGLLLPCLPADGGTECLARCHCRWQIDETPTRWTCFWRRTPAESCQGCKSREARYRPYVQRKSK
jgi:hypothetical protein